MTTLLEDLEALSELLYVEKQACDCDLSDCDRMLDAIIAKARNPWISVSERLPDAKQAVLVYVPEDRYSCDWTTIGTYFEGGWRDDDFNKIDPSHWQPLPPLPKVTE